MLKYKRLGFSLHVGVFLIFLTIWLFLFHGEPDVLDGLVHFLMGL